MKQILLLSALVALVASCTPPKEQNVKADRAEFDTVQSQSASSTTEDFEIKRSKI